MTATGPRIGFGGLALVVAVVSACEFDGSYACTTEAVSAFAMEIRDSISGQGLAARSVATVADGGFSDTLALVPDADSAYRSGVYERAGTYDVTVTAAGYQTWTLQNVVVESRVCHVEPVHLLVRLQPE